jgi:hypothetical protein
LYENAKKINISLRSNFKYFPIIRSSFLIIRKSYSISSLPSPSIATPLPVAIKVFDKLDKNFVLSYRDLLKNKGSVYCFINIINNKQYIGSEKTYI